MKQLEVQIMGQSYLLGCPDGGEARMREAVERVDSAMCKIRDAGKTRARDRIAVLVALNLAFDLAEKSASLAPPEAPSLAQAVPANADAAPHSGPEPLPEKLRDLAERLDTALGQDGQLL